uniref:fluoride efflux transporter CrcB n=1 Tax=Alloprevotella sp. TaxID=1872471 RepID=UPI004029D3EF
MRELLCIFLGGGLGSICRYSIGAFLLHSSGRAFPWATLAANVIGCLCIGLLSGFFERRQVGIVYLLLVTGFCGGFTTFSTFSNETFQFLRQGLYFMALSYIFLSLVVGLIMLMVGFAMARNL